VGGTSVGGTSVGGASVGSSGGATSSWVGVAGEAQAVNASAATINIDMIMNANRLFFIFNLLVQLVVTNIGFLIF
jgi:hypothetical protein